MQMPNTDVNVVSRSGYNEIDRSLCALVKTD